MAIRNAPKILGIIFIALTTFRIARFASDDSIPHTIIGVMFAVALAASVYVCAYFTAFRTTRRPALALLVALVATDGLFNLTHTLAWSVTTGRWNTTLPVTAAYALHLYRIPDTLLGASPTIFAAMFGWLTASARTLTRTRSANTRKPPVPARNPPAIPEWLPHLPATKAEWLRMVREGAATPPATLTGPQFATIIGRKERAAQMWLKEAKNGNG